MEKLEKEKLLYIMGIDWSWIYQRPQIIEQHLEECYDVMVVFPRSILKFFTNTSTHYPQNYKILWTFPWQEKNRIIGTISRFLNRHIFRDVNTYNITVVGYPLYYRYISDYYTGFLIYDCMDNYETLYADPSGVPELLRQEKALITKSRLLFASSQMLVKKLQKYHITHMPPIVLLRNGTMVPDQLPSVSQPMQQKQYKLGYFGTIAEWFDINLLLDSLEEINNIEYHLIGPIGISIPEHPKLMLEGVVRHDLLHDAVQPYACLIMPFRLDETVLYVDPVKLYEYIVMGKCIISVYYPEIERFEEFVYFYRDSFEYIQLLYTLRSKGFAPKYTSQQRQVFLEENSWQERFRTWDRAVGKAQKAAGR